MYEKKRLSVGLRWIRALGMWALDRGSGSCVWRTTACERCYSRGFARVYPLMKARWEPGGKDDKFWHAATPEIFEGLDRVRLCTRGEPITRVSDVMRIYQWATHNPETTFWLTTKAWQAGICRGYCMNDWIMREVESLLMAKVSNVKVLASVDPFTSHYFNLLVERGWSTIFFGDDRQHPAGEDAFKCSKTWHRKTGACAVCRDGCFSEDRVDVWLKEHGFLKKASA